MTSQGEKQLMEKCTFTLRKYLKEITTQSTHMHKCIHKGEGSLWRKVEKKKPKLCQ